MMMKRRINAVERESNPAFFCVCRRPGLCLLLLVAALLNASSAPAAPRNPPKVGLVLSGGGARGAAHIGVLKVFEREGIPIDCIAGTSFGALVGGLYALGYKAAEIEQIFTKEGWTSVFSNQPDMSLAPLLAQVRAHYQGELYFRGWILELPGGLLAGQRLVEILDRLTTERTIAAGFDFDKLVIPFRAVATDLVSGNRYVFRDGSMTDSIRASIAAPPLFTPVEKDGMLLADGGLVDNLPTDVARDMGADIVIAVDVTSPLLEKEQIKTFIDVLDQSIGLQMQHSVESNRKLANLVLRPDLKQYTGIDYTGISQIIQIGADEAEKQLPALKSLLAGVPGRPSRPLVMGVTPTIASVSFEGLKAIPATQLRNAVKARAGQPLDINVLEKDLSRLYATSLFDQVDFHLAPAGNNAYSLTYTLREYPLYTLGAAIRYDPDYGLVALGEVRARQLFHTPSTLTISSQFGGLDSDFARLQYVPFPQLPFFYLAPEVHLDRREYLDIQNETMVDKFTNRQIGGQLMVGTVFKRSEIEAGYQVDHASITGGTAPNRQEGAAKLRGLRFNLNHNTLDAQLFPARGTLLSARIDEREKMFGSDFSFTKYALDFRRYFPVSKKSTVQIYFSAGHERGSVPFYERFYLGGFNVSDGGPRHLIGFGFDELPAKQMGIAAIAYRYQWLTHPLGFVNSGYLTGYFNAASVSDRATTPYDFNLYQGGGAELAFNTLIGPMRFAGGWGEGGRYNFYFTFGPAF
jgi:NTE family protein